MGIIHRDSDFEPTPFSRHADGQPPRERSVHVHFDAEDMVVLRGIAWVAGIGFVILLLVGGFA